MAIPKCMNELSDVQRQALATELGYEKIGKELPDGVSLNDIVQSLPKEVRSTSKTEYNHFNSMPSSASSAHSPPQNFSRHRPHHPPATTHPTLPPSSNHSASLPAGL